MARMKEVALELEYYTTNSIKHTALILAGTHPDNEEALNVLQSRLTAIEYRDFMFDVERIMDKYQHRW